MPRKTDTVYFVDGFSPRRDLVGVAAYLTELTEQDVEHTRFFTIAAGKWKHRELDGAIVSVIFTQQGPCWWLLNKRGDVVRITPSGVDTESIADAGTGPGKLGYLNRIVNIAGSLYTCGFRRQVYRRQDQQWVHMDQGILAATADRQHSFYDMDGTAPDDIYAVGRGGEIFYFDGVKWHSVDTGTNVALQAVCCIKPDLVYACGENGIILRGAQRTWKVLENEYKTDTFWAVENYNDEIYLAHDRGIVRLDGDIPTEIDTGIDGIVAGYRLHASDGFLWSIGTNHVARFDGKTWVEFECPDNM